MSAKKTAEAALAVSEEALQRVYAMQRGNPVLLLAVVVVLGYLFYINYYVVKDPNKSAYVLSMYHNANLRMGIISILVLGMSGVFGQGFTHLSAILGFAYVTSYVTVKNLSEGMEDTPKDLGDVKLSHLHKKLSQVAEQMYKNSDMAKQHVDKREKEKAMASAAPVQPDEMPVKESMGNMSNYPLSHPDPRCTPCPNGSRMPFNPRPHEPDSPLMGIGNDRLPPMGVDFLSAPPGVYSQSQIAYEMGMS